MLETKAKPDTVDVSRLIGRRGEDDAKRALLLARDRKPRPARLTFGRWGVC